jgi:Pyruvate/2-oxoacid:ferredoxin oxidoreductase gamma subunit
LAIVIDASLLDDPTVTAALRPGGGVIVNTSLATATLLPRLKIQQRLLTVDASGIAMEIFGKDLPNTAMIAAANQATGFVPKENLHAVVAEFFTKKYNQDIGEKNLTAMTRAEEGFK